MRDAAVTAIERAHGALALAATGALAWAAWRATRRTSRAPTSAGIVAAALATLVGGLGIAIEPAYRRIRPRVFLASAELGWLFERKEHLGFGAIALAWCAAFLLCALHLRAPPAAERADPVGADLRRAAARALVASTLLAVAASIASVVVAQHQRL